MSDLIHAVYVYRVVYIANRSIKLLMQYLRFTMLMLYREMFTGSEETSQYHLFAVPMSTKSLWVPLSMRIGIGLD